MAGTVGVQINAAVRAAIESATQYVTLVTQANPLGSAGQLLGRPDVDAMLLEALSQAQATAQTAREAAVGRLRRAARLPVLAHLLGDVARAYDSLPACAA